MAAFIIITAIVIVVALLVYAGHLLNLKTLRPKTHSQESTLDEMTQKNFYYGRAIGEYEFEDVSVISDYGYRLSGKWLPFEGSKKTVLIVHGYSANLMCSARYIDLFYTQGFNVLMYDHRFHGKSEGENSTLGYYEKYDLKKWIDVAFQKTGEGGIVGLHGESMGASTSILTAALDHRIAFVVADCGFDDLYGEVKYQIKQSYNLPEYPAMLFADFFNRIRVKHGYRDVSPIKVLDDVKAPILFIHGENDLFTPPENSKRMYEKYGGKKRLYIAKNAGHACAIHEDKEQYYREVIEFLSEIEL